MNIEGGELGQQKAQQGLLLVAAVAGFRLRRLTQIQRYVAIAQDQLTKYRLEFVEGAPEIEVGPHLAKAQGEATRVRRDHQLLQLEGRAALGPVQPDAIDAGLQLAVGQQGIEQRLSVLIEQGAANAHQTDQMASSTKKTPRANQPRLSQR